MPTIRSELVIEDAIFGDTRLYVRGSTEVVFTAVESDGTQIAVRVGTNDVKRLVTALEARLLAEREGTPHQCTLCIRPAQTAITDGCGLAYGCSPGHTEKIVATFDPADVVTVGIGHD